MSKGMLKPISDHLMNENQIVCNLAKATLGNRSVVNWDKYAMSYDAVRDDIARVIPGFEDYNQRVRIPAGFYLPNAPRTGKFENKINGTRIGFAITELPKHDIATDEYRMGTIRSHDQFNTTLYGLDDRYRGIHNERRVIFMNEQDMLKAGFKSGEKVDLFNYYGGVERVAHLFVVVPYNIPEGNTATYYPEANVLIPIDSVAEKSNTPTSKLVFIKIKKHEAETQ
jgi:anaerobic selenocysteine-containing dehydrogenase